LIYSNAQRIITWDHVNEILYSGERNGTINQWNKNSEPQFKVLCNGNTNYYLNSKDIKKKKILQSRREKNLKQMNELKKLIKRPLNKKELEEFIMPEKSNNENMQGEFANFMQQRASNQTIFNDNRLMNLKNSTLNNSGQAKNANLPPIGGAKEKTSQSKTGLNLGISRFSSKNSQRKIKNDYYSKNTKSRVKKSYLFGYRRSGGCEKLNKMKTDKGHVDAITVLLPLPKLQFLASAGLDSKIILWDTIKLTKKREYFGFHRKGIVTLQFNENLIILISGGIDHNIFIWNPYIGKL
jgi:WD40 repeat protein